MAVAYGWNRKYWNNCDLNVSGYLYEHIKNVAVVAVQNQQKRNASDSLTFPNKISESLGENNETSSNPNGEHRQ